MLLGFFILLPNFTLYILFLYFREYSWLDTSTF